MDTHVKKLWKKLLRFLSKVLCQDIHQSTQVQQDSQTIDLPVELDVIQVGSYVFGVLCVW
jgi:hypothetical protein